MSCTFTGTSPHTGRRSGPGSEELQERRGAGVSSPDPIGSVFRGAAWGRGRELQELCRTWPPAHATQGALAALCYLMQMSCRLARITCGPESQLEVPQLKAGKQSALLPFHGSPVR